MGSDQLESALGANQFPASCTALDALVALKLSVCYDKIVVFVQEHNRPVLFLVSVPFPLSRNSLRRCS